MNGYKTIVTGIFSIIGGAVTAFGIDVDAETLKQLQDSVLQVVGGVIVANGLLMIILRKLTTGPLGPKAALIKMLMSYLSKEKQ